MVKAQMKIQQMALMLLAITLFFAFVLVFVIAFKFSGLKQESKALEEKNAMLLVAKIANSPEFSCGESFGNARTNCIDADKVMMLKQNIAQYKNFWGVAAIEIRIVYPEAKSAECTLSNFPDCSIIKVFSKNKNMGTSSSNFVSLCRKEVSEGIGFDKCDIARLIIYPEDKTT